MADIEIVASAVGFDQVNKALDNTNKSLSDTAAGAKKAGDALNNQLRPGAAQANQSLVNLGRVVQDAPFGFIGIANNIDPLLGSFQRLKQETGSVGGALKALGSSLMGGGGLAFAVSAITSLLVVFGDSLFSSSKNVDTVSESTQNLIDNVEMAKASIDAMNFSLETTSKIKSIDFKIQNADKGAQTIFDAANNVDLLDKKLVESGVIFSDLRDKQRLVASEFEKLTTENIGFALSISQSKDYTDQLTESQKALVSEYNKLGDEIKKVDAERQKLPELIKLAKKEQQLANIEVERSKKVEKDKLDTLEKYLARFRESLKDEINIGIAFGEPRFVQRIRLFTSTIEGVISKFNQDPKSQLVIGLQTDLARLEIDKFISEIPSLVQMKAAKAKPIDLNNLLKLDPNKFVKSIPPLKLDDWRKKFGDDLSKAFTDFKSQSFIDAITGFAESISNVIIGKMSFGEAFKNVFASLGDNIKQLGQQLIKIGVLAKIAQEQLFLNPTAAIAAGVGLVILGGVLRGLMAKNAFATGTSFAPGGMALVGERGPELVNLPRGSQVIPAAQTASMIGGRNSVEVYGILRGQDIYFSNKKYSQTYNRQS